MPHGIGRLGARRVAAEEASKQSESLRRLYATLVPSGSTAFDIGANVGNRVRPLLACGANVIAVEPQPSCVESLRRTFADEITVVQAAIGRAPGRLPLHVSAELDVVATLSPGFIAHAKESNRLGEREWSRTIEVEVTTLDSLIARFGEPSFIKIDVEGFEGEALAGLSRPVNVLSFEWTSGMPAAALACIDRSVELGMRFFQFSFGESALFAHRTSLDAAAARQLVIVLGEDQRLFGDIYASTSPIVRQ